MCQPSVLPGYNYLSILFKNQFRTMNLQFSTETGPHERQLRRKYHNPLFAEDGEKITERELEHARQQDQATLRKFLQDFQALVQQAADLQANTDSEIILDMKERLDQCYTRCCAMPGDHSEIQAAINQLIQLIMKAVRQGAANDPLALSKLEEEDMARATHQQLHTHKLIVDLLLEDSPINDADLLPTLLSETPEAVQATLQLFDAEQLQLLYDTGKTLLNALKIKGHELPSAWSNLTLFENVLLEKTQVQTS